MRCSSSVPVGDCFVYSELVVPGKIFRVFADSREGLSPAKIIAEFRAKLIPVTMRLNLDHWLRERAQGCFRGRAHTGIYIRLDTHQSRLSARISEPAQSLSGG